MVKFIETIYNISHRIPIFEESLQHFTTRLDAIETNQNNMRDIIEKKLDQASKEILQIQKEGSQAKKEIPKMQEKAFQAQKQVSQMQNQISHNMVQIVAKTIARTMIQHLDYHLTTHCNLNCKGCSTFSPIAEEWFAQPDSFEKDMKALHWTVGDTVQQIHLLGGEPLLHPNIEQFAVTARKIFPCARIDFTTNGLLIRKMPDSFWDTLRQTRVAIKFSRYPIGVDYEQMISYIREKGVEVFSAGGEKPIEYFRRIPLNPKGTFNMFQSYVQCPYTDCAQLRDGKLFRCPASAFSDVLNRQLKAQGRPEFVISQRDYIDLNTDVTERDVFSFLSSAIPFCAYCDMFKMDAQVKWETSKQQIEEWVDA